MPRYLTPTRLCLLVLIRIYQDKQTSSKSSLNVLDFIAQHVATSDERADPEAFGSIAQTPADLAIFAKRLQKWSSSIPGRSMYDILLHALWELKDLDAIDLVLTSLRSTVGGTIVEAKENRLTPASPLGIFIRRCHVEYTRLQFADVKALWKAFVAYRSPSFEEWAAKYPQQVANYGKQPELVDSGLHQGSATSSIDADNLLGFAIHQLQKLGTRVPPALRERLDFWMRHQVEDGAQPLRYFMTFFESWRAGQYSRALDSLHQYFDYSLAAKTGNDSMKIMYQYAMLHLSVLHADFECWEESVDAMNECIATARENQDIACLNFALSWLLYLRHARNSKDSAYGAVTGALGGIGDEQDEILFLKTKAKEVKNWVLLGSTLLEEAKLELRSGGSTIHAHEHILQALHLSVQHDQPNVTLAASVFRASSFERLGQAHLARRSYEIASMVDAENSSLRDIVRAKCRVALGATQSGDFDTAFKILGSLTSVVKGVLKLEQYLTAMALIVHCRQCLHKDDHDAAEYYLTQLRPARSFSDPDTVFEIDLLGIEYFLRIEEYDKAMAMVGKRLADLKATSTDIAQRLTLLALKTRIYAQAGQPSKGFAVALRTASLSERHSLIPIMFQAIDSLTRILLDHSEFEAVQAICEAALPKVLELDDAVLAGRLFVTMGESYVGMYPSQTAGEQQRSLKLALDLIERGRESFQKAEDFTGTLDCLSMKSRIARACGDEISAEQADEIYLQLLQDKNSSAE